MKRMLLAGLLGGLVVFVWGAVSHMVLPIGTMGLSSLPNEDTVLEVLRTSVPEPGLYFFPGMDPSDNSKEAQEAFAAKYRTGPVGLLVYRTTGGEVLEPRLLVTELLTNILAALLAAWIVARSGGTYLQRALLVGSLGLFAWISISLSYWNWYGFPAAFVCAEGIDQVVGWFLGGLVIARLAGPRAV